MRLVYDTAGNSRTDIVICQIAAVQHTGRLKENKGGDIP